MRAPTRFVGVLLIAAACSTDAGPFPGGSVRVLAITGSYPSTTLVEYAGPPLGIRRSMPLLDGTGHQLLPRLRDGARGGFYAERFVAGQLVGAPWELLRYDENWTAVDSISGSAVVGSDSFSVNAFALTPDGRYLVVQKAQPPVDLVVLDAATLAVINRIPAPPMTLYEGYLPHGTVGSQVLLRAAGTCGFHTFWMSIPAGVVTDTAAMPCNTFYAGAAAPHRLYVVPQAIDSQLTIFDGQSLQVVARQDTLGISYQLVPDTARGEVVEILGPIVVFADAHTLHVRRILSFPGTQPALPSLQNGVIDPASGALVGAVAYVNPAEKGFSIADIELSIIDVAGAHLVAQMPVPALPAFLP